MSSTTAPPVYGQPQYGQQQQHYAPPAGYHVAPPPYQPAVQPLPGLKMRAPLVPQQPGQILVSYEEVPPEAGCCKCDGMKSVGLISIVLIILFGIPCLAFIPCLIPECYERTQRPVYSYPPGTMPVGVPPPGAGSYPVGMPVDAPTNK